MGLLCSVPGKMAHSGPSHALKPNLLNSGLEGGPEAPKGANGLREERK